jgi:hypothetical protein
MCCSATNCMHVFYFFCCCWFLVLMHYDQIECMGLFLFSFICWGFLCALRYDQFWRRFYEFLRIMYTVQKLYEIFCRCRLGLCDLWCGLVLEFLHWFFCFDDKGVLKSPTTTVLESICVFMSFRICLEIGCTDIGCIKVDNCYYLLLYFPFY